MENNIKIITGGINHSHSCKPDKTKFKNDILKWRTAADNAILKLNNTEDIDYVEVTDEPKLLIDGK